MNNITCSPHSVNRGRRNGHIWSETTFANNVVHLNSKRKMAIGEVASRMIFYTPFSTLLPNLPAKYTICKYKNSKNQQ